MSAELHEQKIYQIMNLIGVSPPDFARAAANFRQMPEAELDARLKRLHEGESRIETWRSQVRSSIQKSSSSVAASNVEGRPLESLFDSILASNSSIGRHLADLSSILDRLRRWGSAVPQQIVENVAAIIDKLQVIVDRHSRNDIVQEFVLQVRSEGATDISRSFLEQRLRDVARANEVTEAAFEKARTEIASLLQHPILWSDSEPLGHDAILDALARIENGIIACRPDLLVGMHREGMGICQLVALDLKFDTPVVAARGSPEEGIEFTDFVTARRPRTICVVGHVAWSGATMARAIETARKFYHADRVFGVVLAASGDAVEELHDHGCFIYHQFTEAKEVRLDFNPVDGLTALPDRFVLGDGKIAVKREALRLARERLTASYSPFPASWE